MEAPEELDPGIQTHGKDGDETTFDYDRRTYLHGSLHSIPTRHEHFVSPRSSSSGTETVLHYTIKPELASLAPTELFAKSIALTGPTDELPYQEEKLEREEESDWSMPDSPTWPTSADVINPLPTPNPTFPPIVAERDPTKANKCPHCDAQFTRAHNLRSHLLTHSQEKPYGCETCSQRFRRLHDLKRHRQVHTLSEHRDGTQGHNITLYVCKKDDCDNRQFPRLDNFRVHLQSKHKLSRLEASRIASALKDGSFLGKAEAEDFAVVSSKDTAARESPHSTGSRPRPEEDAGQPMRDDRDDLDIDMIEAGPFTTVPKKRPSDEDAVSPSPDKRPRRNSEFTAILSSRLGLRGNHQQRGPYDSLDILERQTYSVSPPALPVIRSSAQEDSDLPSLQDALEPTNISSAHNSLQSPSFYPPAAQRDLSVNISDERQYSDTPSTATSHGTSHIRQRRARRASPAPMADESDDAESAPLLPRHYARSLSATSSTVDWSNRSSSDHGQVRASTPQDPGSPSSTGSSSNQSGAASTNTGNTTVSGGSGPGPSGPSGQSSTQPPSISGGSSHTTQVGSSPPPPPPPSASAWLIGFFKAPPAIMLFCEIILLLGMAFQITAAALYFLSSPTKYDGTFADPDFLSLCANFCIQTTGLYVILFGISKLKEPYLGCWIVCVTLLSFVCSSVALGVYFVYTTLGDSLMTLAGLLQVWIWKMIVFKRREEDDLGSCGSSTSSRGC